MMQLVGSNGTVLLEREKSCATRSKNSILHVRLTDCDIYSADGKTTFQFRTPNEGGVEL